MAHLASRLSQNPPGSTGNEDPLPPLTTDISPQEADTLYTSLGTYIARLDCNITSDYQQVAYDVLRGEMAASMVRQLSTRFDLPPLKTLEPVAFGFARELLRKPA